MGCVLWQDHWSHDLLIEVKFATQLDVSLRNRLMAPLHVVFQATLDPQSESLISVLLSEYLVIVKGLFPQHLPLIGPSIYRKRHSLL